MAYYEVVILDDQDEFPEILSDAIREDNRFIPVTFKCPNKAIEYVQQERGKVALFFSDLQMPEMDGLAVREELLKKKLDLPFVVLTAFWDKELAEKAMSLRVDAFAEKSADIDGLSSYIEDFALPRSLALQEEAEMLSDFVEESEPMLDDIEELILQMDGAENIVEDSKIYMRYLHTIKGTSACMGLGAIAGFSHKYEDFLGEIKKRGGPLGENESSVLLKGLDHLREAFDHVKRYGKEPLWMDDPSLIFTEKVPNVRNSPKNAGPEKESPKVEPEKAKGKEDKIYVPMNILDEFMEDSGELTILRNAVAKTLEGVMSKYGNDESLKRLEEMVEQMSSSLGRVQRNASEVRLVPVKNVTKPFARLTRDLGKELGKKIALKVTGEEIMIDTSMAKVLSNGLVHMVRNSIDHGLEGASEREAKGKPGTGNLRLDFLSNKDNLEIILSDDGRGLNKSAIIKKALENKIFTQEEIERLSDDAIHELIFHPGFSTAEVVSDVSGRGVGMDMVRTSIVDRGGKVSIQTTEGSGTSFRLIIPKNRSVTVTQALVFEIGELKLAVPTDKVSEVLRLGALEQVKRLHNRSYIDRGESLIELIDLADALHRPACNGRGGMGVVLTGEQKSYCLMVDEVQGLEEIVIRRIRARANCKELFMGSCLLGDGKIALVLDYEQLSKYLSIRPDVALDDNKPVGHESPEYLTFLFEGRRFALEIEEVHRLEQVKLSELQWSGRQALVSYRGRSLPVFGVINPINEGDEEFSLVVSNVNKTLRGVLVEKVSDIRKSEGPLEASFASGHSKGVVYIDGKAHSVLDCEELAFGSRRLRGVV